MVSTWVAAFSFIAVLPPNCHPSPSRHERASVAPSPRQVTAPWHATCQREVRSRSRKWKSTSAEVRTLAHERGGGQKQRQSVERRSGSERRQSDGGPRERDRAARRGV